MLARSGGQTCHQTGLHPDGVVHRSSSGRHAISMLSLSCMQHHTESMHACQLTFASARSARWPPEPSFTSAVHAYDFCQLTRFPGFVVSLWQYTRCKDLVPQNMSRWMRFWQGALHEQPEFPSDFMQASTEKGARWDKAAGEFCAT